MNQRTKDWWHRAAAIEQMLFDKRIDFEQYSMMKNSHKNHYPGGRK